MNGPTQLKAILFRSQLYNKGGVSRGSKAKKHLPCAGNMTLSVYKGEFIKGKVESDLEYGKVILNEDVLT